MKKIIKTAIIAICSIALILPSASAILNYNNTSDEQVTISAAIALCSIVGGVIAFVAGHSRSTDRQQVKQRIQIIHDRAIAYNLNRTNRLLLWLLILTRILLSLGTPTTVYIMFCDADSRYVFSMYIYLLIAITIQNIANYCIGISINLHNLYIATGSCVAVYPQLVFKNYIVGAIVLSVGVALNSFNIFASLLFLLITAIPIAFYWYFSVKPYYKLFSEHNMRNEPQNNKIKVKPNFNDRTQYETYLTSKLGVRYSMNKWLRLKIVSKSVIGENNYLELLEMHIAASEFYSHLFAHIGIAAALLSENDSWYKILLFMTVGFLFGEILSQSSKFIIYNGIVNIVATFYNAIQRLFIIDIVLFVLYIALLKTWWMIPIHIAAFFLLQNIFGISTIRSRSAAINNIALHYLPELQDEETETEGVDTSGEDTAQEVSSPVKATTQPTVLEVPSQPTPDETRLAEIEAELKKIPVAKVKQWYADGKLSDEQYKAIAKKYNTLKNERDDIKSRLELLKNI